MSQIILMLLFLICLTENKNFKNSIVQVSKISLEEIQQALLQPSSYRIKHLLDSKIEGTKIAFLSSTLLEAPYINKVDQIIHLIKLDLSSPQFTIFNNFLEISPYNSFTSNQKGFWISKILSVNPLIIYINSCLFK